MKRLLILILFISQTIVSQNGINEKDYLDFIYNFLNDNDRDKNAAILNVYYTGVSNLTLDHLKTLEGKSKVKGYKLELNKREIDHFVSQIKRPYVINPSNYNDLNIRFVDDLDSFYDNIKKRLMLKEIDYKEARFLRKQILTFSQPLFTLDKKTAIISYSLSNSFSIVIYKFENYKWVYKKLIYFLIGCS